MKLSKTNSVSGTVFDIGNVTFMLLVCITMLYPFIYIISLSLGGKNDLFSSDIIFSGINLSGYRTILKSSYIMNGFVNSFIRVGLGTSLSIIMMMFAAYPLSKKYFPHRNFWTLFIVFTMFFSGGLIPNYILIRSLGLMDKVWALVLPGLIATFNMLIMRNYFASIPESLEESARIDGANDIVILFRIIIPVSLSIIATVVLWSVVGHWNAWFDSLLYINSPRKHVLQVVLRGIVIMGSFESIESGNMHGTNLVPPETVKAATIVVAMLPILLFYPLVQKYFVKGIMIGSLKG